MVFYLWDFGVVNSKDVKFGTSFVWDVPLLDGYPNKILENKSDAPGTHHFSGLDNPDIVAQIKEFGPDAILLFGYNYKTHLKLIFDRSLKSIPFIFRGDSHNLFPISGIKSQVSRSLRTLIFKRFSAFLSVGTANEGYLQESGVSSEKLFRAPHCIDNDRFRENSVEVKNAAVEWRKQMGIPKEDFVFLFAGKFEEKKRPLDLLRAFHALGLPRSTLLFVGGGELEGQLRAEAGDGVYFAPFQNQSQMPRTYATADCLVLPSFGRAETWGVSVNEAMNIGKPVIVSNHVGCAPDLVYEKQTGWVFEAGNMGSLIEKMNEAVANPKQTKEFGKNAQQLISNFSYGQATTALMKALNRI